MKYHQLRTFFGAIILLLFLASCSSQRVTSSSNKKSSRRPAPRAAAPAPAKIEAEVPEHEKAEQVVQAARSYLGTPYRYGGNDKKGIDCSGLLVCSFRAVDISLPRTSAAQSGVGKAVSLHELQPGDLVFFTSKKWGGKVSHAGMVTEVRSREEVIFIHSSSSKGVVESNLLSPYYRNIFVKARRPF